MGFALFTVAYNLYAFRVEYKVIAENTAMIREIDARIASKP
jgi:cbb3-type cytochrome oxidase subunit 3